MRRVLFVASGKTVPRKPLNSAEVIAQEEDPFAKRIRLRPGRLGGLAAIFNPQKRPPHKLEMPHSSFKTWSLFLISNPGWLRNDSSPKILSLYDCYTAFARAIGSSHAAVWFTKTPPPTLPLGHNTRKKLPTENQGEIEWRELMERIALQKGNDLAAYIDTDRCAAYATKFGLKLANSPHVVVTTEYPDLEPVPRPDVILELGSLNYKSVEALLTELATQLLHAKLDQLQFKSQRWWYAWRYAASSALKALSDRAKDATISINFKRVKVKIPPKKMERIGVKSTRRRSSLRSDGSKHVKKT